MRILALPNFKNFASVIVLGAIVFGLFYLSNKDNPSGKLVSSSNSGQALIGGDFILLNHNGNQVTNSDFAGKYMLVFFGFTHCPEICPTNLSVMSQVIESLGEKAKNIAPIFITTDPNRDSPEVIKEYLDNFHSSIIGLTGDEKQIKDVIARYKVYSSKVDVPDSPAEYVMDHSAFTYLMDPDGKYLKHFAHNSPVAKIKTAIEEYISK